MSQLDYSHVGIFTHISSNHQCHTTMGTQEIKDIQHSNHAGIYRPHHWTQHKRSKDYYQELTLPMSSLTSDIATLKGDAIAPWALSGTRSETCTIKWNWPIQQNPPKAACKMWAMVLQETFDDGDSLDAPLGSWLMDKNHQNNEWWLDQNS
jgi:hypothetical protein